jgi:tRNA1Val (adenine37-N6)-methyltransferase
MEITTDDTFFNGRLKVQQPRDGYRYSIDAILLADFTRCKMGETVVDLGTGCGIIPLVLAARNPGLKLFGVEIQDKLAWIASENVRANRLEERVHILHQDMKDLKTNQFSGLIHQVVCNPPYRRINSGRINPHNEKAGARHEIFARLADVVDAAARLLELSGRFTCIYPAVRLIDMTTHMRRVGLEPKRMRWIHSRIEEPARLVLVSGVKGGRPALDVEPPLVIYKEDGAYTAEVEAMFQL